MNSLKWAHSICLAQIFSLHAICSLVEATPPSAKCTLFCNVLMFYIFRRETLNDGECLNNEICLQVIKGELTSEWKGTVVIGTTG